MRLLLVYKKIIMIIVKLMGGLGNQMFQYACARHLAEKNNDIVKLDLSWYQPGGVPVGDTVRPYALDRFAISAQIANEEEIVRAGGRPPVFKKLIRKIVNKMRPLASYSFDRNVLRQTGNVYLEGFFQNENYFKDIEFIIRNEFQLRGGLGDAAHAVFEDIGLGEAVSVHIRRGDYISNAHASVFHGTCSPEYYRRAIDAIIARVDAPRFFVFSDDIEWVKTNINIPAPVVYVSNPAITDHEELVLMSKCDHNIIANSSFSWWGAWLNQYQDKIVIAPTHWSADGLQNDIVPKSWMRM